MRRRTGFEAGLLLAGTLLLAGLSACIAAEEVENSFDNYAIMISLIYQLKGDTDPYKFNLNYIINITEAGYYN